MSNETYESSAGQRPPIMTIESIIDYGFKEFDIHKDIDKHDRQWQYCLRDNIGKKFYVNIRLWAFSRYSTSERIVFDSFDAYCQFDLNGPKTFNVDLSVNNMSPDQVVDWFHNMFLVMNCSYYEKYSEDLESCENYCKNCNKYLTDNSTLCVSCQYECETGFQKFIPKRKRKN